MSEDAVFIYNMYLFICKKNKQEFSFVMFGKRNQVNGGARLKLLFAWLVGLGLEQFSNDCRK